MSKTPRQEMHRKMHELVDGIVSHFTNPEAWPLTDQERVVFMRKVMRQAKSIQGHESYRREAVKLDIYT